MAETTRRDVVKALPALSLLSLFSAAGAQEPGGVPETNFQGKSQNGLVTDLAHCTAFPFAGLATRLSDGGAVTHDVLRGALPTGELMELHETTIEAGKMPHPPHQHAHVELILVREGTVDFMYAGKSHTLTPGSVGYTAPNEMHGFRNSGPGPATYFIMSVGKH